MHSFLMQDWTTVRGASSTVAVAMSERDYVDMRPYQDVVFWPEVKFVSFSASTKVSLLYETAPAKEEALFTSVRAATDFLTPASSPGLVTPIPLGLLSVATTPVSRWLRWRITSTSVSAWEITFRLWIAAGLSGR